MVSLLAAEPQGLMMIGTNHRQAPLDFREKIAFHPDEAETFLKEAHQALASDCFLLSTCNRTEFYTVNLDKHVLDQAWRLLAAHKAIDTTTDLHHFYRYEGRSAVQQLFRVATGIDSQMLGEPQILQQVKAAYEASQQALVTGVVGERLLAAAIRCGKRARAETHISQGAVSVAQAAVSLTHKVFSDLSPRSALVVGAGETGELVAHSLAEHGIGRLLIANRTLDRARDLATRTRGEPMALDDMNTVLAEVDIVITSTSAPSPILSVDMVRTAMKRRSNRTFLIVDIGVPRDVHPDVRHIDNVFLQDVDSLQGMIDQSLVRRRREVPQVERIINEEVDRFLDWYAGLNVAPVIKELRGRLEELRNNEITRAHLTPEQRQAVEQVTHGIMNKILHRPMRLLREASSQGETGTRRVQTIREIFGLDPDSNHNEGKRRDR